MTNEEVIEKLKYCKSIHNGSFGPALKIAIKALEQKHITSQWVQISPAKIYECSRCGQNVMTDDIVAYKYCHGCGAKMEVRKC